MNARLARLVAILALCAAPAPVHADPALFGRALVLDAHELDATVTAAVGAYPSVPVAVASDLWFGVSARWTVGVIDSDGSIDRIGVAGGVCIDRGCGMGLHGGGVEARWRWRGGTLEVVPRARLVARGFAPLAPAVTTGAIVRWTVGRFAITSDPYVRAGLSNADGMNPPALVLPVWFEVAPSAAYAFALHAGWGSSLPVVAGAWHAPLALDLRVRVSASVELLAEGGFTSFAGPTNSREERIVSASVSSRW